MPDATRSTVLLRNVLARVPAFAESLAVWSGTPKKAYDIVRGYWEESVFPRAGAEGPFTAFWNRTLERGVIASLDDPAGKYVKDLAGSPYGETSIRHLLRMSSGLTFTEPQGAYYVMVDVSPLGFPTDTAAAEWLIKEVGVAGVPGSSFFREPEQRYIRFHFAKKEETLRAAGEKLARLARGR